MIPLAIILVIPAGFAVIYGPTQLNPDIAGILFMVEIGVGTITASIMTDEAFGLRELLGVLMITSAALIEPLRDLIQHRYGRGQSDYLDIS
jgi:drug/metabolite transporter (DMT)-like permease